MFNSLNKIIIETIMNVESTIVLNKGSLTIDSCRGCDVLIRLLPKAYIPSATNKRTNMKRDIPAIFLKRFN